jgi:hypothetical protein
MCGRIKRQYTTEVLERSTPEVLGVDDFALRKGVKYGTILLNLERYCLVDLLPIVDHFHLSQNVGETVVRIMRRNYDRVKELLDEVSQGTEPIDQSLPFSGMKPTNR